MSTLELLSEKRSDGSDTLRMIVGLGNPGEDYENTPHNIGFAVVQELAIRHGVTLQRGPKPKMKSVKIAEEHPFILLCPMSYMNLSGQPVSAALKWYSLKPKDLLVVCDDANLPLGRIRIRTEGGAGGQKGLASIIQTLGTQTFARVRVGVGGGEPGADLASYVLSKFRGDRRNQASKIICKAADAVECWLTEGMDAAMNKHNQQETEQ